MKKYRLLLLLPISFFFIQNSFVQKNIIEEEDEVWSGTVSFVQKQTGSMIVTSEWKMEAIITSNKANAIHSFHSKLINGDISDCKTASKTELSVGIDYNEKMYSIQVSMPGCYGKQTSGDRTVDFAQSDETAIRINDQPLKDPNVLEGTLTEKEGTEESGGITTTSYTWHLERIGKKYQPPSEKNSKPKPGITGKVSTPPSGKINKNGQPRPGKTDTIPVIMGSLKKELWSGTVTWTKTSSGKAKVVSYDHGFENVFRWDHYMSYHTDVNFIKSKGTVSRADTVTKWEKDSTIFIHPQNIYMIEERNTKIYRKGKGDFDLDVEFSEDKKTYWISFFGPICPEFHFFEKRNNIHGTSSDTSTLHDAGFQTTLPADFNGYPIGANPDILSGTFQEIIPANPDDPAHEVIITRARWELKKVK